MGKLIDLTGQRFGRWEVIGFAGRSGHNTLWRCRCDCGVIRDVRGDKLKDGSSRSCGCLVMDQMSKHHASNTRLYRIWGTIKRRCYNLNDASYHNYGTKGVAVCDEWLHDFSVFQDWSLSNGYTDNSSVVRIDKEKGYSPENCKWISKKDQMIEIDGVCKTLSEWAEYSGVSENNLRYRLRIGDSGKDLIRPTRHRKHRIDPKDIGNIADQTGKRFGHWTIIGFSGRNKHGMALWKCLCDCGSYRLVEWANLKSGISTSCGCQSGIPRTRHGSSDTRLYNIWHGMRDRCNNPDDAAYKNYGGRGITVCSEWNNSFPAFQEWALSHGYQDDLTIDRIDVNGSYTPNNCRWATVDIQANNRRNNVWCVIDGESKTIAQWATYANLPYGKVYSRYLKGERGHDLIRPVNQDEQIDHAAKDIAS